MKVNSHLDHHKKFKMNKYYSALILFILITASCSTTKPLPTNLPEQKKEDATIVFVVFKIVNDSLLHERKIELVKKIESPGKIKLDNDVAHPCANYLDVNFYDDTDLVKSIRIEHPLYKRVEFTKEDNSLTSAMTRLPQAEFFLRVQLLPSHNYTVKISEVLAKQEATQIATIPLLTQSP